MKRAILSTLAVVVLCVASVAQGKTAKKAAPAPAKAAPATSTAEGYNIPITLAPYKNTLVYLGCYYGKYKNLVDSAYLDDKSQGVFKSNEKLPQGIYFAVSPSRTLLFEFLMDKGQHFSIKADTTQLDKVVITGSPDNQMFQDYMHFLTQKSPHLNELQKQLGMAKTKKDSAAVQAELKKANKELQDYRENIMTTKPESMLSRFFYTMKRPETPDFPKLPNGKVDSLYPYRFVKDHYWDGVSFSDEALVRTPFFEPKLDEYFKYYVVPESDSVISEVNYMMLLSRESRQMEQYLLGKFTDKYINPEYMGLEKVFLWLFDKYYSKGDTSWLGRKQVQYIFDRAYSLMLNQVGEQGANLEMLDTANNPITLYGVSSPYTFLVFWDPNCGHCKEMVPRIDSMYEAKWKKQGVKVVGVNIAEDANPEWRKFLVSHNMKDWINMYEPKTVREEQAKKNIPNFRQLYDVFKTPTLYLLDKDKHIIAKSLALEQFDEVLQAKIKKEHSASK